MAESMDRMSGLFRDTREPLPIHTLRNFLVYLLIRGEKIDIHFIPYLVLNLKCLKLKVFPEANQNDCRYRKSLLSIITYFNSLLTAPDLYCY